MYKITVYIPVAHTESVKQALFAAGAGKIAAYDCCAYQTLGQGQFRPLAGSRPFLGEQDKIEQVDEYRVEVVCTDDCIKAAIVALKQAHPYEEPAYDVIKLEEGF
jgi:hypothetical protein